MIERLRGWFDALGARPSWQRWLPVLAWGATIWWLSSRSPRPGTPSTLTIFVFNGGHVVLFGTLAVLAHAAQRRIGRMRFLLAVVLASCYGAIDELHQAHVPGRDSSVFDWCSDTSGAVFGAALATWSRESLAWARRAAIAAVPAAIASVSCATFV